MKKDNQKKLESKGKNVEIKYEAKELTNYSGINPIAVFMNKLGFKGIVEAKIGIKMHHNIGYSTGQILMTTILGILSGMNRIIKIENFSSDPLVRAIMGIKDRIDKDTIIGRLKRFTMINCVGYMDVIEELSKKVHKKLEVKKDIIDLDSTVKTVYGNQQGAKAGYNPTHRGKKSYHPLLAFLNSTKECILAYLRPGDTYTSNNASEFMKELLGRLPKAIKELILRADSGFFNEKLLRVLELSNRKVEYIIKVKLKNMRKILIKQEWEEIPLESGIAMTEFYYQCHGWEKARRFVAIRNKVKIRKEGLLFTITDYEYFCYVTNIEESPLYLHKFYGDRGESENWIEAVKNQLFGGFILTDDFWANEALFLSSVLAYNISLWMRILTDKKSWHEEPGTFRLWFIQVAGKIVNSGRRIFLNMSQSFNYREKWEAIYNSVCLLSFD